MASVGYVIIRDEMINRIISESSKLAHKEYDRRHDRLGKRILWELCKKLKFDHIYTNHNQYLRMRHTKFSRILR